MNRFDSLTKLPFTDQCRRLADAPGVRHLEPLYQVAQGTWCLTPRLRLSTGGGAVCPVPEFSVCGDAGGHGLLRVGVFAGFARDQFDTVEALALLLLRLSRRPVEIDGLHVSAFPFVNRTVLHQHFVEAFGIMPDRLPDVPSAAALKDDAPAQVLITITTTPSLEDLTARVDRPRLAAEVVAPALRATSEQLQASTSTHVTRASASPHEIAAEVGLPSNEGAAEIHLHAPGAADHAKRVEALVLALHEILHRLAAHGAGALRTD
jgi:hypothetical protein